MNLELLKRFYAIAKEGNLTKAANKMNVAQSALTRSIHLFENQLKTTLFDRTTKKISLTPQGERLYIFAEKFLEEASTFEKIFHEKEDELTGEIKIMTLPFGGAKWLVPSLKKFLKDHLNISFKISLKVEINDFSEADVFILPLIPHQPHFIQKYLYTAQTKLFASKNYLKENGIPQTPQDLNKHQLITYRSKYYTPYGSTNWILNVGIEEGKGSRKAYIEIDSLEGILNCVTEGYGIAELPDLFITSNPEIERVLPDTLGPCVDMYYIFPEKRKNSRKIAKLFNYLWENTQRWT